MTDEDRAEADWVGEVLRFWFDELGESRWFAKDEALDAEIRSRFLGLHEDLVARGGDGLDSPRRALAAVLALDQFPRNMFRGSPRAFAADRLARDAAQRAVQAGLDVELTPVQRMFLYLPFEHSEDPADQALAVRLIGSLGNDEWTRYAIAHRALVERFGRFPHRNAILGRASTPDEELALKGPMGSF